MNIEEQLITEFNLKKFQVENTIALIDEGNTIPFIARYRKEKTGQMNDIVLRDFYDRLNYLRNLETRKEEIIRLIDEQGKLTDELTTAIFIAKTLTELEDIYRPYKQKKRTRATIAKEKGLEPLAEIMFKQEIENGSIEEIASKYIDVEKGVENSRQAIEGAMDIIAEQISDNAEFRKYIRELSFNKGTIVTKAVNKDENTVYNMYYDFSEPIAKLPSHRILAINRGEAEKKLKVSVEVPVDEIVEYLNSKNITGSSIFKEYLLESISDSYKRLIGPSIERDVRNELEDKAGEKAIKVFGVNVKNLLLQAPIKGITVMGFDPAYRTGCKIAVIDEIGKVLATTTVYPTEPQNDVEGAEKELLALIEKHNIDMIAIGNGTASRESEMFVSEMIKKAKHKVYYTIVSEAGASVYSASKLASEEYPDINVSIRGAISIARRLQDPLAELVKIDPKSIGVGQYQHDVNQKKLDEALTGVVEDSVNKVGVDLNTATASLLSYVSGINKGIAQNIVKYREENGKFEERKELLKVSKLGNACYTQCAGFLRIPESKNILDNTGVHPESYEITERLINSLGYNIKTINKEQLEELKEKLDKINLVKTAEELGVGVPTLTDIVQELKKPGRDPREEMPKPILRSDVLKIDDLTENMVLTGTVRNVIDFGAFVDIGIKNDGLVHISEISNSYIKNPSDVLQVGDIVKVKVIGIDREKGKVSLSMKNV
ncbi:MAG: RNA-binding transcriptional accessory protein [Clostridiales bacterium]|nr:RNA-binding transcriptional accessory protein [Clostridiales bacterium]